MKTICEFETDCGHTISAMSDDNGREFVIVKKPGLNDAGEAEFIQTPFLKPGTSSASLAEQIFHQMQF